MVLTRAFGHVSRFLLVTRIGMALISGFGVGLIVAGFVGMSPQVQELNRVQSTLVAPAPSISDPFRAAAQQVGQTLNFWLHIPEVCQADNAVNDFQRAQCGQFWKRLAVGSGITVFPVVLALIAAFFISDYCRLVYRRFRHTLERGQATSTGVVVDPAQASSDGLGWFLGLPSIRVQLPNGKQIEVYVTPDDRRPAPGETLAVFDAGKIQGKRRWIAIVYSPYVAVRGV